MLALRVLGPAKDHRELGCGNTSGTASVSALLHFSRQPTMQGLFLAGLGRDLKR
jgi:hypothetical protein